MPSLEGRFYVTPKLLAWRSFVLILPLESSFSGFRGLVDALKGSFSRLEFWSVGMFSVNFGWGASRFFRFGFGG